MSKPLHIPIGRKLRGLRVERGYSLQAAAEIAGPLVSWRQLQAIEVGEGPCRAEQLAALATAYRLTDAQVAGLVRAAGVSDG